MRKALTRALLALIALGALVCGAWAVIAYNAADVIHDSLTEIAPAQAVLVLGTSPLARGGGANPYFTFRIDAAAELYKNGKVKFLIVSGNRTNEGRSYGYDEPTNMRDSLIAQGVPASAIYRDYAGFRTLDSILRAHIVFGQDRVIVISQRFHLERALFLAKGHGLLDEGYVAEDVPIRYGVPTKLREAGARVKALIDMLDNDPPRYGGKPVALGVDAPT